MRTSLSILKPFERMNRDDGTRRTMSEVFGSDYRPVDDGFEPEFD